MLISTSRSRRSGRPPTAWLPTTRSPDAERIGAVQLNRLRRPAQHQGSRPARRSFAAPGLARPPASRRGRPGDRPMTPSSLMCLLVDWKRYSPSIRNAILDTLLSSNDVDFVVAFVARRRLRAAGGDRPCAASAASHAAKRPAPGPRRGHLRPSKPTAAGGRRRLSVVADDERRQSRRRNRLQKIVRLVPSSGQRRRRGRPRPRRP